MSMRKAVSECNLNLHFARPVGLPALQRVNDQTLMEAFMEHYRGATLVKLNACRLYLKITWLSDIADTTGTRIVDDILRCVQSPF